jgi:hypothetical protein
MFKIILTIILHAVIADTQLPVGSKNQTIKINENCQETKIVTNYKHIKINIGNVHNIDKLIITDKPLIDCNIDQCHDNSTICQSN